MDTDIDRKLEPGVATSINVTGTGCATIPSWQLALLHKGKANWHVGFQGQSQVTPLETKDHRAFALILNRHLRRDFGTRADRRAVTKTLSQGKRSVRKRKRP